MTDALKKGRKVVGVKQSLKAIRDARAAAVFLADDADDAVRRPVLDVCQERGVGITPVGTMAELGALCGIEVGAAVAALLYGVDI